MIKLAIAISGLSVLMAGCGLHILDQVKGSGKSTIEVRKIIPFHSIAVAGPFDVTVIPSAHSDLQIEGDDNLLKLIETEVKNGVLEISTTKNISTNIGIKITVSSPSLSSFTIAGSGTGNIQNVTGESLEMIVTGSGEIKVKGLMERVYANVVGSGSIDTTGLKSEYDEARVTGSGEIKLGECKTLDAGVTGSGTITYNGNPTVKKEVSGSGTVSKAD